MTAPAALNGASETTPLLAGSTAGAAGPKQSRFVLNPFRRLCLTCFLLSTAFFYTASIILVEFRTIACEIYYDDHPPYEGHGDRCSIREIDAHAASEISWMVTWTTISGLLNLLWTGWVTRKFGVKIAMVMQTTIPLLRNLCQQYAVYHRGWLGIYLLQYTQLITIFGGGAGYMLTANTYTAELVSPEERTGAFGVIQGIAMAAMACAYTLGGVTADTWGPLSTFQVTFVLLVLSSFLSFFFLPAISPPEVAVEDKKAGSILSFLSPLKVFVPRKLDDGSGRRYYGLTLLALGVFGGVLATGYVPLMLQLHSTNAFGFGATENGALMSTTASVRALFLTLLFPKLIARGRKWYAPELPKDDVKHLGDRDDHTPAGAVPGAVPNQALPPKPTDEVHGSHFDLAFVRWSMVLDGILTGACVFATQGWQMYIAAAALPWASGTAPAAKGVVMELVGADERSAALTALSLVETVGAIVTVSGFGFLFAFLSEIGKPGTVFLYNGGVAFLAAAILLMVRFPPKRQQVTEA